MEHYERSDALIFRPSVTASAWSQPEAWSRGLPVITTDHAGASDLLKTGENGLLIKARACRRHRFGHRMVPVAPRGIARHGARPPAPPPRAGNGSDYRRALASALSKAGLFGASSLQ